MVKRVAKESISEDDGDSQALNDNGKRPTDASNVEPKKRLKTKSVYRQPTANELNRLQETANLFNSNLFRLQVEEILEEVKVKEKTEKKFLQWYTEFKSHLLSILEDETEYDLTEPALSKKLKVKLPFGDKLSKTKCVFKFHKFTDVEIVGSYAIGSSINSKLQVNIQIAVPADTYTKNDSVNYRYHKKRAAYLAVIAAHLKDHETVSELNYSSPDGCETRPVLDITPSGKLSKHLTVRLDLTCEAEAYKLHRFSPARNNLREAWLFSDDTENNDIGPPTPYYNSSILRDLTSSINEEFLKETLLKSENLKQAVVLLKIWIRQRNLKVSGYIVSMIIAHLVQTKRVNNIMSSYQIVRNVWIALKSSEWDLKGVSLYKGENTPTLEEFHHNFPVVFLDKTGCYNILWQMCKGTYNALKWECALAVDMLDNGKLNSFLPLFMTPVRPLMQFDHIVRFKNLQKLKQSVISKVPKAAQLNYGLDDLSLVTDTLHALLAKGLGNRVDLILQMVEADSSWPVKTSLDKARKDGYKQKLSFGIVLNPETYMNSVEKGPPANLPEAEQFRAFWGDKSELRRFQDGSITETVVWEADSLADRRGITAQIIDYLLQLKFGIQPSDLFHVSSQLEALVSRKQYSSQSEEASLHVLRAFDELRRDLRQLTQLPLDVSTVAGISPVFSYCEPCPALPLTPRNKPWRRGNASLVKEITREDGSCVVPEYMPTCNAVIELGHSGKWPGDIQAFRCLKAAFNLQIADRLQKQYSIPTQAYPTHIDVLKQGLVFRLEIAHPKEITLLRKEMENGVAKFKENDESIELQCRTVLMPRLRGALHGLHQKHPAFGPTACIFKRWLSGHLLAPPHVPAPLADLLAAAVYLQPQPHAPPTMPTAGFLRVLRLLAETDWAREMIVLDFNDDMKREEIVELENQFSTREPQTAKIHIVTSYDGDLPSAWSLAAPGPQVLARVRTLAQTTLNYATDALLTDMKDSILGAFVPSLAGYDVTIHLHPELVPYSHERAGRRAARRAVDDVTDADVIPVVDFHPVQRYLDELRTAFGEFALFFHDSYGGEIIAVLWKPDIGVNREFQPLEANALKPVIVKGEKQYKVNIEAIVADFRSMGQGLVKDVVVN